LRSFIREWLDKEPQVIEPEVVDVPLTERERRILDLFVETNKIMGEMAGGLAELKEQLDNIDKTTSTIPKRQDTLIKLFNEYAEKYLALTKKD
jgi:hypothetical protein